MKLKSNINSNWTNLFTFNEAFNYLLVDKKYLTVLSVSYSFGTIVAFEKGTWTKVAAIAKTFDGGFIGACQDG